jgi:hypothetical protein
MGGSRVVQRAVFGVLGASAVVFALLYGITTGQLLLGVLGAGAAAAVAFTFATWRSTPRR